VKALPVSIALAAVLAQPLAIDVPLPPPLRGARLIETKRVSQPLELKQATADSEAVIAGQSYLQQTYEAVTTAPAFLAWYRDAFFAAGWKLIDVTKLDEPPGQPRAVTVSARLQDGDRNVYARVTLAPDNRYQVNVADVAAEDWAAQLSRECRVRVHSIHFAHNRPIVEEFESEPTLRKLADLIKSKHTPAVRIEGHMDAIGEAGRVERETLSLGRARTVVAWLTTQGGVPADKVTAHGLGQSRPIAENDSDLGRALNRRIEVARTDCQR
jgi:outer membrane protein OmpA-like peptidoglycan-associated protein